MNKIVVSRVLTELFKSGVRDFCLCSGSRNSDFVAALNNVQNELNLYRFFEERSAGFFALGKVMSSPKQPVAVIVTSGTAAVELLPSCVEAYYQGRPVIYVTADRPKSYRGSGAPQSIEQKGLFDPYVEKSFDIDVENFKDLSLESWLKKAPIHINCSLEEEVFADLEVKLPVERWSAPSFVPDKKEEKILQKFLKQSNNLLVMMGSCSPQEVEQYFPLLEKIHAPIWADASSNVIQHFPDKTVFSEESFLEKNNWTDILRLGSVPSCRYWRDLEKDLNIRVCSIARFSGLARDSIVVEPAAYHLDQSVQNSYALNLQIDDQWKQHTASFPESELTLLQTLSQNIGNEDTVFLGNSLPIREWNRVAEVLEGQRVFAARGANGIDGQISTALGVAENFPKNRAWIVLGDLTTLYDLSAPCMLAQLKNENVKIVVVNNDGGEIFSRIPRYENAPEGFKKLMKNSVQASFEDWAKMWNLPYSTSIEECKNIQHSSVLELKCSSRQTREHLIQKS